MTSLRHLITCLLFLPALALAAESAAYRVGDAFEAFTTKDQHEQTVTVAPADGTRHVIVSFTMGSGKDANRFFEKQGATFLPEHQAVFLANIHGMPAIGRMFALPKMKKYPHRILLGDDAHLLDRYPMQADKLTVLDLDAAGRITSIRFLDAEKDLLRLFAD